MKLNGQIFKLDKYITLLLYLQECNYDITKIAVELNGNIVSRATYSDIVLSDDDVIEVVSFVGGG